MDDRPQQKLLEAVEADEIAAPLPITQPEAPSPHQRETAPRASETRKATILETTLDAIITINHKGRITEFNPAAEQIFGYSCAEALGQRIAKLIIPPSLREQHHEGLAHYLATGEGPIIGKRIEIPAMRADGSEFLVELTITRVPMVEPPHFTGYIRDISERKQAERELSEVKEQLAIQLADMTRLHEFSTRLASNIELKQVLEEALASVVAMQGTNMGTVSLYDSTQKVLRTVASTGFSQEYLNIMGRVPPGMGPCGTALKERHSVLVEDIEQMESFKPYLHAAALAGYRAAYSAPLFSRSGEVMGTIGTYFREPHLPSSREIRLVELYARQVAQAVENAQLYHKTGGPPSLAARVRQSAASVMVHYLPASYTRHRGLTSTPTKEAAPYALSPVLESQKRNPSPRPVASPATAETAPPV